MAPSTPKRLVLVGGGHSHALVLKYWQNVRAGEVDLTLISDSPTTPYSGMVPGYMAGFYDRSACLINLADLCHRAGGNLIIDRAIGLDLTHRFVRTNNHRVEFDLVSIDIGSSPWIPPEVNDPSVIPVKPIGEFLCHWHRIREINHPLTIGIVGGGAGGVELAFAINRGLKQATIHLFHQGNCLLPGYNPWVQQMAWAKLGQRGIKVHLNSGVVGVANQVLTTRSGFRLGCDFVLWVTQGRGAPWLRSSGLALDDRGYILVNPCLRSVSHAQVFAAGDIATLVNCPLPKAGVVAVRQALPLYRNLRRALSCQPLQPFRPRSVYLSLIGTGDGRAIGAWGKWGAEGRWLWHLKDYIDRGFIKWLHGGKTPVGAP
jgi:selenide,water dikinase